MFLRLRTLYCRGTASLHFVVVFIIAVAEACRAGYQPSLNQASLHGHPDQGGGVFNAEFLVEGEAVVFDGPVA